MPDKAGRVTKLWNRFKPSEEDKAHIKDKLKRAEIWRGASDSELAKEIVQVVKEIENRTYEELCQLVMGDLTQYRENPVKLLSYLEQRQGRLIAVRTLMAEFVPNEEYLTSILELIEKEGKEEENASR